MTRSSGAGPSVSARAGQGSVFERRLRADAVPEHPVRPSLVGHHDGHEHECDDAHHLQRVGRGRRVVDREAPVRVEARHHHPGVQRQEDRRGREGEREAGHCERPPHPFAAHENPGAEHGGHGQHRDRARVDAEAAERVGPGVGGDDEQADEDRGDRPGDPDGVERPHPDGIRALQVEEDRAVRREDRQRRQAGEQRVRIQEVEEPADVGLGRVDGHALEQVPEGDAPEQGRDGRPDEDHRVPRRAPRRAAVLAAELEGHGADDQGGEHQEQGEVEAAEQRGVPVREGREDGAARGQHPHLVAVPDRADRVDDPAALRVRAAEGQQDADAVVEALEDEEAGEEDADQDEPERVEIHGEPPPTRARARRRRGRRPRGPSR